MTPKAMLRSRVLIGVAAIVIWTSAVGIVGVAAFTARAVRCAIESLPYETPKLSATAVATMDGKSFADALERAILRSQQPPPLNGPVEPLPATIASKPMQRYRRF